MTCILLADMLYERNWNAEKRAKEASGNTDKFRSGKTIIDKYACYDGSGARLPWLNGATGTMSDRQEAAALIRYARERHAACKDLPAADKAEYGNLINWTKTHKQ